MIFIDICHLFNPWLQVCVVVTKCDCNRVCVCVCVMETVLFSMLAVKEENISPQEVSSDGQQVDCVGPQKQSSFRPAAKPDPSFAFQSVGQ